MTTAIRTIEAVYEKGCLRPLSPIEGRDGLIYIVTVVDVNAIGRKSLSVQSVRGKYRGRLSSSDEFARSKQNEKALER